MGNRYLPRLGSTFRADMVQKEHFEGTIGTIVRVTVTVNQF